MKKIIYTLGLIVVALAVVFYIRNSSEDMPVSIVVERADISQEVFVTGQVRPEQEVTLSFNKAGKIVDVLVDIGDQAHAGQILALMDQGDLPSQLLQSEAGIEVEQAKLDQLKRGTRSEEIAIKEAKVLSAKNAVEDAESNLVDTLRNAYIKSDDAVRNQADQLLSGATGASPSLNFQVEGALSSKIATERVLVEQTLNKWGQGLASLSVSSDLSLYVEKAKKSLKPFKPSIEKEALTALANYVIERNK